MDFEIPAEIAAYLRELDAFIDRSLPEDAGCVEQE